MIFLPDDNATKMTLTFKITDIEGDQLVLKQPLNITLREQVSFLSVVL